MKKGLKSNSLKTINEILFKELERLDKQNLSTEQMRNEVSRANALSGTSKVILNTINIQIKLNKLKENGQRNIVDEIGIEND